MADFITLVLLLVLLPVPLCAQTPTIVSGTITDASGIPYSFAKVSAQLIPTTASPTILVNGNPTQIGGQNNAAADAGGSFSVNLFCNTAGGGCSAISPGGTQWQFTVQTNGEPFPFGTGPQTCIALVTVTGASQSVTSNFSSCPALTRGSSGGGSPSVGSQFKVQTSNGVGGFQAGGTSDNGTTLLVNEDAQLQGPNPSFDIRAYGATTSGSTMTCSINASSTALSCTSNPDFQNGQGVVVPKAGATTSLPTPPTPTVTPAWILNGATTYSYQIVAEDRSGGLTAASAVGSTTTGAATLGLNTLTLTSCSMTDGTTGTLGGSVATYTSSGNHNLQAGAQVDIEGFTGGGGANDPCNGTVTVASTPTATTFTVYKGQVAGETNTAGTPTAKVWACNELTYAGGSVANNSQIRYWVYRNNALVGVAVGLDPHFIDCGLTVDRFPAYVPSAPPGVAQPGYLSTTISSGGGTTTLTLANAASNTATSQTVLHDNVPALRQALQAALNASGGTAYIPNAPSSAGYSFNSIFDTTTLSNPGFYASRIWFNSTTSSINQPWILRRDFDIEGEPHNNASFQYVDGATISGNAQPLFYALEGVSSIHLKRIRIASAGVMQTGFYADEGVDGGGIAGVVFDDVSFGGGGNSKPVVAKIGFDFIWNRGVCDSGTSSLIPYYCVTFSRSSTALTGSNTGFVIGRVKFDKVFFAATGMEFDCRGASVTSSSNSYTLRDSLFESVVMPYVKATGCAGSILSNFLIDGLDLADNRSGCSTPVVDSTMGGIKTVIASRGSQGCPTTAFFISNPSDNAFLYGYFGQSGNVDQVSHLGGSQTRTRAFYPLPTLPAPSVAVSAGGSVPIGSILYQTVVVDIDGNETAVSPSSPCVTTTGNQTCTVTAPTLPSGSIGWRLFRNAAQVNLPLIGVGCSGFIPTGVNFVDTSSFGCGQSSQVNNNFGNGSYAGQSVIGPNGVSTPTMRLMNSGFTSTSTATLTANRNITWPDASGTVCLLTTACPPQSWGIAQQAASGYLNATSSPAAFSFPVTKGNLLYAVICTAEAAATYSFSDTLGQGWTTAVGPVRESTAPAASCQSAYIANTVGGADIVTCASSATAVQICRAWEIAGAATSNPIDVSASNAGTAATALTSGSVTTTTANDFVIGVFGRDGNNCDTAKPGSQFTSTMDLCVAWDAYAVATTTGSYNPAVTLSPNTGDYAAITVAFKPGTGAAQKTSFIQSNYQNATSFFATTPPTGSGSACTVGNAGGGCIAVHLPNATGAGHLLVVWAELPNSTAYTITGVTTSCADTLTQFPGSPFTTTGLVDQFYYSLNSVGCADDVATMQFSCSPTGCAGVAAYIQFWEFNLTEHAAGATGSVNAVTTCASCVMTTNPLTTTSASNFLFSVFDVTTAAGITQMLGSQTGGWQPAGAPSIGGIDWGGGTVSGSVIPMFNFVGPAGSYTQTVQLTGSRGYDAFLMSLK